jgi:hypothetical protein
MSDSVTAVGRRPYASSIVAVAAMGLASALLYVSIFLSFAFLLPLQIAFGRYDRRAGFAAAGVSALGIAAAQTWRIVASGAFSSGAVAGGQSFGASEFSAMALPIVLIGALLIMNASLGDRLGRTYKAIGLSALCALALLPLILTLDRDASIASYLEGQIAGFLAPLKNAAGEGYDASVLMASLDPKELVAMSIATLRSSYAAVLFLLLGASWRLGNRLSGLGSKGREATPAIDKLRLPYPLIWGFLGSWALVLASLALKAPPAASAIAWNAALTFSLAYAAQGLGIVIHLCKSWNMPKSLRVLIAITAILALLTPFGIAVAVSLPLFGVTEIWIPYRKPKGVGA